MSSNSNGNNGSNGSGNAERVRKLLEAAEQEGALSPSAFQALAIPDLVSGKLDVLMDSLPSGLPHVKEGRLRALGITSAKRSPLLPDLPAIAETVPGYESVTWFGMYGPKGLPADIVARVNTALNQALQDAEVKERLARLGIEPAGGTPQQFAAMAQGLQRRSPAAARSLGEHRNERSFRIRHPVREGAGGSLYRKHYARSDIESACEA